MKIEQRPQEQKKLFAEQCWREGETLNVRF